MANSPDLKFRISINGKEVKNTLKGVGSHVKKVQKELSNLTRGTKEYKEKTEELKKVTKIFNEIKSEIKETPGLLKKAGKEFKLLAVGVASVFTISSMLSYFSTLKQKVGELSKLKHIIKGLTDLEGKALEGVTAKTKALSETFEEDTQKMSESANALSKNMEISFDQALELIQKGFLNGANANDEFLDKVREYPALLKEAGLSAEQSIKLMEQEVKKGIYSDKGVDAIKEANLRLREMPKSTKEAIDAIGLSSKTISEEITSGKKTVFQVIQDISKRMSTLPPQSKLVGQAIADIFGGPGEDAGLKYLANLHNIDLTLKDTTKATDDYTKSKILEIKANESLNTVWLQLTDTASTFSLIWNGLKLKLADGLSYFMQLIGLSEGADNSIIKLRNTISTIIKMLLVGTTAYFSYNAAVKLTALLTGNATKSTLLNTIALRANTAGTALARVGILAYQLVVALLSGNIKKATIAMQAFSIATKLNPIGLLVTAITAAITAFALFSKNTSAAAREQKALIEAKKKAASIFGEEEASLKKLLIVAQNEKLSKEQRTAAIKRLNELAPEYLGNLTLENINTKQATASIEKYIEVMKKRAEQKALEQLIDETVKKRRELEASELEEHVKWYDYLTAAIKQYTGMSTASADIIDTANKRKMAGIGELIHKEAVYTDDYVENLQQQSKAQKNSLDNDKKNIVTRSEIEQTARKLRIKNIKNLSDVQLQLEINKEIEKNNTLAGIRQKAATKAQKESEKARQERLIEEELFRIKLTQRSKSYIVQEIEGHQLRLRQAQLHDKQRHQMTASELKMLEVLELEHKTNITRFENKAIQTHLENLTKGYEKQKIIREIARNNEIAAITSISQAKKMLQETLSQKELESIKTLKDAKSAIHRTYENSELEHQEIFLNKQVDVMKSLISGEDTGINLADKMLTDEQKELLNGRIEEVKQKLSEIGIKQTEDDQDTTEEEPEEEEGEGPDIFGYTAKDWENTFNNLDTVQQKIKAAEMVVSGLQQVWGMYNDFVAANEKKELENYEKKNQKKKENLKKKLDAGIINQDTYNKEIEKLDNDLAKKKAEIEYKQAKRERAMGIASTIANTSIAIMRAYAELNFVGATIAAAIVGTLGAIQINTIKNQPLPDPNNYAQGGYTQGIGFKDHTGHEVAGTVHANEYVIPSYVMTSSDPAIPQIMDYLESKRQNKNASFADGGYTTPSNSKPQLSPQNESSTMDNQSNQAMLLFAAAVDRMVEQGVTAVTLIGDDEIQSIQTRRQKIEQSRTNAKQF